MPIDLIIRALSNLIPLAGSLIDLAHKAKQGASEEDTTKLEAAIAAYQQANDAAFARVSSKLDLAAASQGSAPAAHGLAGQATNPGG